MVQRSPARAASVVPTIVTVVVGLSMVMRAPESASRRLTFAQREPMIAPIDTRSTTITWEEVKRRDGWSRQTWQEKGAQMELIAARRA